PSTASAAGLPDSALLALAVPASAQFTVGAAPPPPSARASRSAAVLPALRAVLPSGRACATVPAAATTASGAASTNAQAAAPTLAPPPTSSWTLDLWIFPSNSPSNQRDCGLKWTSSRVLRQPEIDCLMGFNKRSFPRTFRGACPRFGSTPSHPSPGSAPRPLTEPRPRSTPLPPVNPADRRRPPTGAERRETGHSVRSNALEPGFHA